MLKVRVRDMENRLSVVFNVTVQDEDVFDDVDDFFSVFQSRSLMDEMIDR